MHRNNPWFDLHVLLQNEDDFKFESCPDNQMMHTREENGASAATKHFFYKQNLYYFTSVSQTALKLVKNYIT